MCRIKDLSKRPNIRTLGKVSICVQLEKVMNKEMVDQQPQLAKSHNFTAAFEQMCFAAIASTVSPEDVLRQLVLQCFVVLPEDQFSQAHQIAEAISVLFGLEISSYQIQTALDQLETQKVLQRPLNTNYVLDIAAKRQLEERLNSARELEERVRDEWLAELTAVLAELHIRSETGVIMACSDQLFFARNLPT